MPDDTEPAVHEAHPSDAHPNAHADVKLGSHDDMEKLDDSNDENEVNDDEEKFIWQLF